MKEVYIYCLKDLNGKVRYIGKTIDLKSRLESHITQSRNYKNITHLSNWIRSLLKNNERPSIEIIEITNEDLWEEREIYWIGHYRNIVTNLCNTTNGGKGSPGIKRDLNFFDKINKILLLQGSRNTRIYSQEDRLKIWELIRNKKSLKEINQIYPSLSKQYYSEINNGLRWKEITNQPFYHGKKRKGYTCRDGLFMVRKNISNKIKVVYSSRNEQEVINWIQKNMSK